MTRSTRVRVAAPAVGVTGCVWRWWLAALLAGLAATAARGQSLERDLPRTLVKVKPSIVAVGTIEPTRRPPSRFVGTGFVVADGRHVLTNAHVILAKLDREHRESLAILTRSRPRPERHAIVVASDPDHDVVVLRFDGPRLPALALGDSKRVREGEVYAFTGFPIGMVIGFYPVTHHGFVSAITPIAIPQLSARRLSQKMVRRLSEPYDVFQLDATAYPGNSGSPLYDVRSGVVVGILNKVFVKGTKENLLKEPSGISYAIPIEYAVSLLRSAGIRD